MDALDTKKEFPSQARERLQWALDAVRANQMAVATILAWCACGHSDLAVSAFRELEKGDRDAITIEGGIFTAEQIKVLRDGH